MCLQLFRSPKTAQFPATFSKKDHFNIESRGLGIIARAVLASSAATHPATHSMPSHDEETKYHHRDHDEGEYPPKAKTISKPCTWKHTVHLLFLFWADMHVSLIVHPFSSPFSGFFVSFASLASAPLPRPIVVLIVEQQSMMSPSPGQQFFIISAIF